MQTTWTYLVTMDMAPRRERPTVGPLLMLAFFGLVAVGGVLTFVL
jgi:hypothetical protein